MQHVRLSVKLKDVADHHSFASLSEIIQQALTIMIQ
ncbi:hypothetical protein PTI45_01925 [Paenibacillus nuruki]|uniref:Uncharacterized protein n=1 Tax=Paenibacillus nuruki TaxID=1886670 RepID=A0A1E3L6N3_9BACL|nr:hypothetical protein PTI45_01925 [Paenibacillus nuruki]CAJ1315535.1 RHH-1 domain-containing protein [Paenibacillus nuruki]